MLLRKWESEMRDSSMNIIKENVVKNLYKNTEGDAFNCEILKKKS